MSTGSGMPQMRAALGGWCRTITLSRNVQNVVDDGFVVNTPVSFTFRGTIQPLSPKTIALKPEGQRAWTWLQIHCLTNKASVITTNDEITITGQTYKVMAVNDYSLNGYIEYHVVKDYQ